MWLSRTAAVIAACAACAAFGACAVPQRLPADSGASGAVGPDEARWTVGPALVECAGGEPRPCLMVRGAGGDWTRHDRPIEGFRFVPGDEVDLLVRHESVPRPSAEVSGRRTLQVRELERRTLPGTPLPPLLAGTRWQLAEMGGAAAVASARGPITMAFDAAGRVAGHSGVNRYTARAEAGSGWLRISAAIGTRMAGPPESMQLEAEFLGRLQRVGHWRVDGDRLRLLDAAGVALMEMRRAAPDRPA